mgnify:CR=1 FL=1|tara:strand:- start:244 stop:1134 length:891 start_codon:yes stop_codon:yes gene_type:complete
MKFTPSFSEEYNISDIFKDYKPQKEKKKKKIFLDIIKERNIKGDKPHHQYNVYSNFGYIATFIAILFYLRYILKNKSVYNVDYLNEILYLVVIQIFIILTLLNSIYYHDCGGIFKDDMKECRYGLGYNLGLASMNDLILATTTLISILILLPRKFGELKIRFFLFIIANISLVGVLSFREIPFIYSNGVPAIIGLVVLYYCFKEIKRSNQRTGLIIVFMIASILAMAALFMFFKATTNALSISEKNTDKQIKEKINNTNLYHGSWHILGGLSGLFFVLYKIKDITNLHLSYKSLLR